MTTTYLAYIPSPPQGVWHLGPIPIRAYALFIIIGIVVALVLGQRRWEARGGAREGAWSDEDHGAVVYDIALWAVPFGLVGGRLYHVITDWRTYFGEDGAGLAGAFRIWDGGLGIWGAVALGGVGAWIGCRHRGIPLPAFADAIAPGIILAQAIGRLGNYFNQELFGRPTTLPWGLEIYERRDASGALDTLNGVSTGQLQQVVHPTFLYELLWNLLVFAALIYLDRRFKIGHGRLFAMYVAGYCIGRFWIELMRSDAAYMPVDGIRVNSFTSTFVFIGAVVYIMVAPKGREDPASLVGKPKVEDDLATLATKELTAVAATTGVVAAAKAAGDAEEEDAKAAGDVVDATDAEALGADVAGVPAESVEDAEAFAVEGEEEPEGSEAGLGAVEGDEVAEAVDAAPEVHDAEVEAADEAEAIADEVAAEAEETEQPEAGLGAVEGDEVVEAVKAAPEVHDVELEAADEAEEPVATEEPEAGLGAVEGDEVAEAVQAAPEVHDAEVAAADEAEAVADEVTAESEEPLSEVAAEAEDLAEAVADAPDEDIEAAAEFEAAGEQADAVESDDSEPDEPETEAAEAAVEEASAEPTEQEAAEEAEAVDDEADSAAEDEPKTGVLEEAKLEPESADEGEPAEGTGGRLSRWLRRNR
ncbi:prolipoprotein diacylglyceryl transferase [Mycobacterium sp. OAS707]|uniref:prolipoprotein diacylglyceryl transferase n=1 Tax=Mycobacterium sp. OAS707 TaxID=2663822 RepID=UPI00178BE4B4|nr:prolipoprotein diacylglyceryl transferase [Mycobacterium sp. OAS707]